MTDLHDSGFAVLAVEYGSRVKALTQISLVKPHSLYPFRLVGSL
jgi:hypothetical protein